MIIKKTFGTTLKEIESKKYNIFLGISIANKRFVLSTIEQYLNWMLKYTKDRVAIIIVDEIQAINYQVFDQLSKEEALKRSDQEGRWFDLHIKEIIKRLPIETRCKVYILHWKDVQNDVYKKRIKIIIDEFNNNQNFHSFILKSVKRNLGSRRKGLTDEQLDRLALYLLDEVAAELDGVQYYGITFDLHPYPGEGISQLFVDLYNGNIFPDLVRKLEIQHKVTSIEAYTEEIEDIVFGLFKKQKKDPICGMDIEEGFVSKYGEKFCSEICVKKYEEQNQITGEEQLVKTQKAVAIN